MLQIRPISAAETVPLRHSVLWPEKPVSYVRLPEDVHGHHYGAFLSPSDETPIAVISVFIEALPLAATLSASSSTAAARFRKFACEPSHQGRGIGTALLQHVFRVARSELGCSTIWCDARVSSSEWYERRGMHKFGEVFYKGPIEYTKMMADP